VVEGRKAGKRIVHDKNIDDDVLRRQAEGGVLGDALVPQPGPASIASRASAWACVVVTRSMCVNTCPVLSLPPPGARATARWWRWASRPRRRGGGRQARRRRASSAVALFAGFLPRRLVRRASSAPHCSPGFFRVALFARQHIDGGGSSLPTACAGGSSLPAAPCRRQLLTAPCSTLQLLPPRRPLGGRAQRRGGGGARLRRAEDEDEVRVGKGGEWGK
jgi:hypothetical protein